MAIVFLQPSLFCDLRDSSYPSSDTPLSISGDRHSSLADYSLPAIGGIQPVAAGMESLVSVLPPHADRDPDPGHPVSSLKPQASRIGNVGHPKYIYNSVTMSELSRGTGYSLSAVSRIFSHDRGLSMVAAKKFARYLRISVDEVIELIDAWGEGRDSKASSLKPQASSN